MAKNIPIDLLKNFISRSLKQILNVNTELEENLLKDSFNEYIEYYKILNNELAKKRILEKLGTYLLLSEKLRVVFGSIQVLIKWEQMKIWKYKY